MTTTIDLTLPVTASALDDFSGVLDAERLVRLHPHWHVRRLEPDGDWTEALLKDHATDEALEFSFRLSFPTAHGILIECRGGPAERIHFFEENSRLHVSFTPHQEKLAAEEEESLTLWLQSIRQYLRLYLKTTVSTRFFRFLMNKAFLKMDPSQRKICLMLYRFTLLEIVVILIIVIGYMTFGR